MRARLHAGTDVDSALDALEKSKANSKRLEERVEFLLFELVLRIRLLIDLFSPSH